MYGPDDCRMSPSSRPCPGKRVRNESAPSVSAKKVKLDHSQLLYPTPDATQTSSTDSSSEDIGYFTPPESYPTCPKPKVDSKNAVNPDKIRFFSDLCDYIALGTITLRLSHDRADRLRQNEWLELDPESHLSSWVDFYAHIHSEIEDPSVHVRKLVKIQWIRLFACVHQSGSDQATFRVYVLPDDVGRRHVDRQSLTAISKMRGFLDRMVNKLNRSIESWEGGDQTGSNAAYYQTEAKDEDSLFYLFNTLPSPSHDPGKISCSISAQAIRSVLNSKLLAGLKTPLYPYQKRTVTKMIKREVDPEKVLDPRFQKLGGPTGQVFYFDNVGLILLKDRREYDEPRGGVLGESMGLGKTLICLATILATKGHWPDIPPQYTVDLRPTRPKVASLMQMTAATVGRARIPWRALIQESSRLGEDHANCRAILEANAGFYTIPPPESKYSRRSSIVPQGKVISLSTATLLVVPQNLFSQWREEVLTHVEENRLRILYLDSNDEVKIPPSKQLIQYDIILMSRPRFEKEMVPGLGPKGFQKIKSARGGCLCSLDEDCHCSSSDDSQTPLKDIHFLRIIMDEGHEFSTSGRSGTTYWALQNLRVDRKWIVSGTPASGLLGVEVGAATDETLDDRKSSQHRSMELLEARRTEVALQQERKDLEKLGTLVTGFLQAQPWANSKEDDPASWQKYIMPHQNGRRKAKSLKTLLESLVVRHRIEDIEADIQLPPLHNRVVYLQPSWHDKLNINLFIMILTVNAVTSERVDKDYMFHPKNRKYLNMLINNLRQSGFYWTGVTEGEISKSLKVSQAYLDQDIGSDSGCCNEPDRKLLQQAIRFGELVLRSASWKAFAELHEMGMFIEDFPEDARDAWSLVQAPDNRLSLLGATPLAKAQSWVDKHLYSSNPSDKLAEIGSSTMQRLWEHAQHEAEQVAPENSALGQHPPSASSPQSKMGSAGTPRLTKERTVSRAKTAPTQRKTRKAGLPEVDRESVNTNSSSSMKPPLKSALKNSARQAPLDLLPPESPLVKSRLYGTASAKLSYLLDQVILLHQDEKILIFYEGDSIAWYIAQALDLLGVRYLIYTKSLSPARQTAYIATFNNTETFRVLLMNVHQAAHGLHIASASRVFFVNPVWQPNVEAQAIKRAHRIGQKKPVFIETLVLKDTLEDRMLQRRRGMTAQEHQKAERSLLDDDTMSTMIQNAQFIPLSNEESNDVNMQVAKLQTPQQLFARPGNSEGQVDDPDADLIFPLDSAASAKHRRKQKGREPAQRISLRASLTPPPNMNFTPTSSMSDANAGATDASSSLSVNQIPATASLSQGAQSSTNQYLDRNTASANGGRRRVGFAMENDEPESPSLFGGNVSFALP